MFLRHSKPQRTLSTVWPLCRHSSGTKHTHARPDWNKAVSDAEKIVGYPTSFLSLRWLLSDEIANVALHLRKLVGSSHPLLKTAKNLLYTGSNNMQAWGLIVLLVSKTVGLSRQIDEIEQDKAAGVLHSQRALAEVTEMIRTSNLIHKGLINIYPGLYSEEHVLMDMEFGNKIALLSGDYLLANSCAELAALKNQHVVELMSSAVRDFAEAEFVGRQDRQNNPLPPKDLHLAKQPKQNTNFKYDESKELCLSIEEMSYIKSNKNNHTSLNKPMNRHEPKTIKDIIDSLPFLKNNNQDISILFESHSEAVKDWTTRNLLGGASLLGKSCQGTLLLAGHNEPVQHLGYEFGKHLALSWQAFVELETFSHYQQHSDSNPNESFNLVSAPVMFHLEYASPESSDKVSVQIENGTDSILNIDLNIVHQEVSKGPGVLLTKLLQHHHSTKALNVLFQFENSDARNALIKIIQVMDNS
uniref:Decaprenyl-diphosphate synthase subunit 2 n=1 Tax=Cacopsylla melanoneura TaxID=428564 RepID=A0A8D9EYP0_9HEMI